jgi:hypothetical protein
MSICDGMYLYAYGCDDSVMEAGQVGYAMALDYRIQSLSGYR